MANNNDEWDWTLNNQLDWFSEWRRNQVSNAFAESLRKISDLVRCQTPPIPNFPDGGFRAVGDKGQEVIMHHSFIPYGVPDSQGDSLIRGYFEKSVNNSQSNKKEMKNLKEVNELIARKHEVERGLIDKNMCELRNDLVVMMMRNAKITQQQSIALSRQFEALIVSELKFELSSINNELLKYSVTKSE